MKTVRFTRAFVPPGEPQASGRRFGPGHMADLPDRIADEALRRGHATLVRAWATPKDPPSMVRPKDQPRRAPRGGLDRDTLRRLRALRDSLC
jgi:hypothetical protein